jgi:flagellar hook assembly protein FlgD
VEKEYIESARQQVEKMKQMKSQVEVFLRELGNRSSLSGATAVDAAAAAPTDTATAEDEETASSASSFLLASTVIGKKFTVRYTRP